MEIWELAPEESGRLAVMLTAALARGEQRVRFALHTGEHGGLQIKVGEGIWTTPLGSRQPS